MKTIRFCFSLLLATMATIMATAAVNTITMLDKGGTTQVTVTAISNDIVKVDVRPASSTAQVTPSLALPEALTSGNPEVTVSKAGDDFVMMTTAGGLRVTCDKALNSVTVSNGNTMLTTDLCRRDNGTITLLHEGKESFYGAGERGYSLNLAGDTLENYNAQSYGYQAGEKRIKRMGITMPMVISSKGYGVFFDDFSKSSLHLGGNGIEYTTTAPAPVSYFVINGHGRVDNVVKNFTWLVGRQELPPLWTLGYITSKYGYRDRHESETTIDTLKREGYPLDGIVLDLYWYGQEEDMGRLSWDADQWPDHRTMLSNLKKKGVNFVTISQPYVLTNGRAIDNYRELDAKGLLCKTAGTDSTAPVKIWVGEGGMFDVSNPATQQWLRDRYHSLTEEGVTGWWGDLGEPEVHPLTIRHYNGLTAEQYHNYYGNQWSKIIYDLFKDVYPERRLMTMMRAGTAGLQRYSVFPWSTDVSRSWGGFQPQVTIMLNSGLSGLGYMSHDVGGFAVDPANRRDGELYIRWLQLGLFSPVLRTHSTYQAEPYNYKEYGDLTLRIIKERYKWLPYNYTLAYENASQGLPLVRPLGFYDNDNAMRRFDNITDEYLWGKDVLVAPQMQQGATSRDIVLPDGQWLDYSNPTTVFEQEINNYPTPIETLPLFVRAGAFIPQALQAMENVGDYNPNVLDIVYFKGNEASSYTLFDDDLHSTGTLEQGKHRLINFDATPQNGTYTFTVKGEGSYDGAKSGKQYNLVLKGWTRKPATVKINGKSAKCNYDKKTGTASIPVAISDIAATTTIVVK